MGDFDKFAGQEVASGIRANEPLIAFEEEATAAKLQNIASVQGLLPKIAKIIVHETRVQEGNLDRWFRKSSLPYGAGSEQIQFIDGPANIKNSGRCVPYGQAAAVGQLDLINLAWSINISIYDREINQHILGADELAAYTSAKLRTPYKTLAQLKRSAQVQLVSDIIDGTRSISGTESSDGSGTSVTYAPDVKGYCGKVVDTGVVMPKLTADTLPAFASGDAALSLAKTIQDRAASMMVESKEYSKLGVNTFCLERPLLIMETRVLNALDNAWALDGANKEIPTKTAREYMGTFAEIVDIPAFADLPTNSAYKNKRCGAVLIDRDSLAEQIAWDNMESKRCTEQRMTGYNMAGASAMSIYRGNPACGFLFSTE